MSKLLDEVVMMKMAPVEIALGGEMPIYRKEGNEIDDFPLEDVPEGKQATETVQILIWEGVKQGMLIGLGLSFAAWCLGTDLVEEMWALVSVGVLAIISALLLLWILLSSKFELRMWSRFIEDGYPDRPSVKPSVTEALSGFALSWVWLSRHAFNYMIFAWVILGGLFLFIK